jgi:SAM-dependent methyltransferase
MLDVVAGHGAFVEPALAAGREVTAVEMSHDSLDRLCASYGANPLFHAQFDDDGSLNMLGTTRFDLILYASVIHHIPDYENAINDAISRHLAIGGTSVSFRDPLWYPTTPRMVHMLDKTSYYLWRISRGNYRRGLATAIRRLRGTYETNNTSDAAEYHVVRRGVDQDALLTLLSGRFEHIEVLPYWFTHSKPIQLFGTWLSFRNSLL